MMKVEKLDREFVFDGKALPDPNPDISVEQVREMYIPAHPEITTATVTGPEPVDGKMASSLRAETLVGCYDLPG